ncbi:HepT-like ribonuclease domain-containing protein [Dyadobacter fermentans]|uniref:HepT-like ribonuclease domain-containing protein n=1 Tax=Dyadobacter fermentans TaxID=94254 RepID=UPI001E522A86
MEDDKTVDAVIRNFEIIGEAASRLPEEFRDRHTTVDWHKIRGFRNRIVHDYFGIDYAIVWDIKTQYLPHLLAELSKLNL